jgi:hypothetical protein
VLLFRHFCELLLKKCMNYVVGILLPVHTRKLCAFHRTCLWESTSARAVAFCVWSLFLHAPRQSTACAGSYPWARQPYFTSKMVRVCE